MNQKNQFTLNLVHLSADTIKAIIENLREAAATSANAQFTLWELESKLEDMLGREEAEEILAS